MKAVELAAVLMRLHACNEAVRWANGKSLAVAWRTCPRANWMLWLASRACEHKLVVRAACDCARTSLQYATEGDDRPRLAIEAAERWAEGKATIEEVRSAESAESAESAAWSAESAESAAWSAESAAWSAESAAAAAHKRMAALVRRRIPLAVIRAALEGK